MDNLITGIDISHNNGPVGWTKVVAATPPISFAYIKATQGVGYKDPMCVANANGASQAGIKIGYYHFASLNSSNVVSDATAEAKWFHSVLGTLPPAQLIPVLDIETKENKLSPQQVQLWMNTFITAMKNLGVAQIMLYSYKPFFDTNLPADHSFGSFPLWLAQYVNKPAPALPKGWSEYSIWQYTDKGKIDGIAGNCDLNKASASLLNPTV